MADDAARDSRPRTDLIEPGEGVTPELADEVDEADAAVDEIDEIETDETDAVDEVNEVDAAGTTDDELARPTGRSSTIARPTGPSDAVATTPATSPGSGSLPPPVRSAAAWAWRVLVIAAAVTVLALGLAQVKTVVVPVLVAALLTSLLAPLVSWLERHWRFPRVLAVVTTLLAVVAFLGGLLTVVGTSLASGISDLTARAWAGFQEGLDWLSTGPLGLSEATIDSYVRQIQEQISANAETILSGALSVTTSVGHIVAGALIAIFCLFFFLKEGRVVWLWAVTLFPRAARERVDGAGLRGWVSLSVYARTQIVVAFIDGVGIGLGAWLLGVPLAIPLGVLVFLGAFIPIVGAILTGAVAVAVALVDQGVFVAVLMLLVVLAVQQLESHVFQPMLMSKALKLHPVAVLLSVATGTLIAGIVGALFAVPFIAVLNAVVRYLNGHSPPLEGQRARLGRRTAGRT